MDSYYSTGYPYLPPAEPAGQITPPADSGPSPFAIILAGLTAYGIYWYFTHGSEVSPAFGGGGHASASTGEDIEADTDREYEVYKKARPAKAHAFKAYLKSRFPGAQIEDDGEHFFARLPKGKSFGVNTEAEIDHLDGKAKKHGFTVKAADPREIEFDAHWG